MHSIEAVDLSKTYGSFAALSGLNLKIEGAKCVGFLGPNGAGKTTTLKLFTDMIRPTRGKALINGISVHEKKRLALEHCGSLIESPEIYPSFTPNEALSMIAEIRGVPSAVRKKRIEDAIIEVKMEEWKDKKVGKFSKGMKQRINIASSLLSEPDILLLDEPTTGLDPRGMAEVRDIVKSLKKRNRLIFMSSHLLPEVSDVCDEVAMIDHGKLLVYDTLSNVTTRFSGDGGASIVEIGLSKPVDDSLINGAISRARGVLSVEKMDTRNLRIKFSGGVEGQEQLLAELAAMKIGMISFRASGSALEDTYLNLIKDTL
ncbi:MAG: ABC transporter ATP-binding protein [Thaumarchaeota archaeon]|nr:ABC transporter ATP-binding protein [Nitrososphaerota archaeon]